MVQLRSGGGPAVVAGAQVTTVGLDAQVAASPHTDDVQGTWLADVLQRAGLVEESRLNVEVSGLTRGGPTGREEAEGQLRVEVPVAPEDDGHVLLVDDGGVLRWELPVRGVTRGARGVDVFEVQFSDPGPAAERGLVSAVGTRLLRVFAFKLIDPVLGAVGDFFVRRWEERNRRYRLRTFTENNYRRADAEALSPEQVRELARGGPTLLLIHGTSSLSHSGFGLIPPEEVRRFNERYEGRVLAFDHPTLGSDPKENAAWLVRNLPRDAGIEVDVLCHSRGGLVARILAERASEIGLDRAALRLRSVTFVATPNGGTPLCDSEHLVDFVDAYTNLLDFIPDNPIVDVVSGLLEVLKQLAVGAYGGLDGAMSMEPRGPFLAWLNQPSPHRTLYRAVAADYEAPVQAPAARSLRDRLMDRVFGGEANDLIVPTAGAYAWNGGSGFPIRERIVLPGVRSVDHSTYWVAKEALLAFAAWLTPETTGTLPAELAPLRSLDPHERGALSEVDDRLYNGDVEGLRHALHRLDNRAQESLAQSVGELPVERFLRGGASEKHGVVILLNGTMGSNLFAVDGSDADHIWLNPWRLANGEFRRLRMGAETIEVRGLHRSYLPLLLRLDQHWDVIPFAFDWRLSLEDSAEGLARAIAERAGDPVHLVAHSMGGLVARRMIATAGELWARMDDKPRHERGGRLIMLGTPNLGTFAAPLMLTGKDRLIQALAVADVRNTQRQIQEILGGFPGIYDLLPASALDPASEHGELFDSPKWGDAPIVPELLRAAAATHEELKRADDPQRMICVLGSGHDTPFQLRVNAPGEFAYRLTRAGDGRVSHDRGQFGVVPVFYADADHAELVRDPAVLAGLDDLLLTGTTSMLPSTPPITARSLVAEEARWHSPSELEARRAKASAVQDGDASRSMGNVERIVVRAVSDYLPAPASGRRPVPTLALRVLHASLEHASHAVILGHYSGTPLAGSEGFLDHRLHGRLTNRQIAGLYPEELGDVVVVPGTKDRRPEAAIVVGLGPRGDLTPTALSGAVSKAVLSYALSVGERLDGDTTSGSAAFSILLIATHSGDGLPVETSVLAIVEGTVAAIRLLAEHPIGSRVRVEEIEFVEMYAQRASRAARAARYVGRTLSPELAASIELRPAEFLDEGEGGRAGDLPAEYEDGSWRRLVVTAGNRTVATVPGTAEQEDPYLVLNFTSMGLQARADQLTQRLDRRLLTTMVAEAMETHPHEQRFNSALYELLLPTDLKHDIAAVDNLHLVVDDQTADFPWELLANRVAPGRTDAIARRTGMLRQLTLTERRNFPPQARENSALVIGNPPGGRGYPNLPGAAREAGEVAELLRSAYRVDTLIFDENADATSTPGQVAVAVLDGDFRVLHIAGHGHYEKPARPGQVPLGGVVIGSDRAYLTASTIGQLRQPPDLVYLNCCHLGRVGAVGVGEEEEARERAFTRRNLNRLAASLARELMAMGVRAVVAAGWPVSDYAAATFARTMYEHLLDGTPFGDAVKFARRRAFEAERNSNTWAAYQCYGDPAFRLSAPRATSAGGRRPVARHELVRMLDDVAVQAGDQDCGPEELLARVRGMEAELPDPWRRADVLVAFGTAYGELEQFREAIRCFQASLEAEVADLPLRAIEQLANFKVRLAVQLHRSAAAGVAGRDGNGTAAEVTKLFEEAEHWLLLLRTDIGPTPERHALLGSLYKRWAATGNRSWLSEAIDNYAKASKPYCSLNALQLQALWGNEPLNETLEATITACRSWMGTYVPSATTSGYWDRVADADLKLTHALIDKKLPDRVPKLREAYVAAFKERSTPRQRASTTEHLLDLAALAKGEEEVRDALIRLHGQLKEWRRLVPASP